MQRGLSCGKALYAHSQTVHCLSPNNAHTTHACTCTHRRYGWISFWTQLVLTTIAAVILLFSMAFTAQVSRV